MKVQITNLTIAGKEIIPAKEEIAIKPKYFMIERQLDISDLISMGIIIASC